jgi:hypothetical protein
MYRTKLRQGMGAIKRESRRRLGLRPPKHNRWLVLNLSIFNSEARWNRIFNPFPNRQNGW